MKRSGLAGERVVALFILGILLFSPPFLFIFDQAILIAGIPVLFLYLFVAWALLIALMVLVIEQVESAEVDNTLKTTMDDSGGLATEAGEQHR